MLFINPFYVFCLLFLDFSPSFCFSLSPFLFFINPPRVGVFFGKSAVYLDRKTPYIETKKPYILGQKNPIN